MSMTSFKSADPICDKVILNKSFSSKTKMVQFNLNTFFRIGTIWKINNLGSAPQPPM